MTVPTFPQSPSDGEPFVSNGITYTWYSNGSNEGYWMAEASGGGGGSTYWDKNGNVLSPKDVADGLEIGGGEIKLNADGTAEFSGRVGVGNYITDADDTNYVRIFEGGGVRIARSSGTTSESFTIVDGPSTVPSNTKVSLSSDGSAEFAGTVKVQRVLGTFKNPSNSVGLFQAQRTNSADERVHSILYLGNGQFNGYPAAPSTTPTFTINSTNGNADFANIFFKLDADNEANYTVTTEVDEEGNEVETRVYNGPTLNVKEVLLALQQKVNDRDAVIADLTTRIAALEGGSY